METIKKIWMEILEIRSKITAKIYLVGLRETEDCEERLSEIKNI